MKEMGLFWLADRLPLDNATIHSANLWQSPNFYA